MRLNATSRLQNVIRRNSGGVLPALVLVLVFGLLVETPVQAQAPAAPAPTNARRAARQAAQPNAAAAQGAAPAAAQNAAQNAVQDTVIVEPLLKQNLPQDPLRVAIQNAVQKGIKDTMADPAGNAAANKALIQAAAITGNAGQIKVPNAATNVVPNAGSTAAVKQSVSPSAAQQPPAVNRAPNPGQPAVAPTGPIPPAINAGIQALVSAKASLEASGNKWGGHKQTAIKAIDQALTACGQTPTPDSGGTQSSAAGATPAMEAALTQLTAAQKHFMSATNAWGGRRDQAKPLIDQALSEVNAAIAFAKSHNTY
jgi:hypothetical protein